MSPTARRELGAALLLDLLGAGLVLVAATRSWGRMIVTNPAPLPAQVEVLTGSSLSRALGLVGLAAVVAIAATRRGGRAAVGVLVAVAGVGVVVDALSAATGPDVSEFAAIPTGGDLAVTATAWPWLAVVGGVLMAGAGGLTAVRGPRWAALGRRYDAPAARADPGSSSWDALDRGEDPTAG